MNIEVKSFLGMTGLYYVRNPFGEGKPYAYAVYQSEQHYHERGFPSRYCPEGEAISDFEGCTVEGIVFEITINWFEDPVIFDSKALPNPEQMPKDSQSMYVLTSSDGTIIEHSGESLSASLERLKFYSLIKDHKPGSNFRPFLKAIKKAAAQKVSRRRDNFTIMEGDLKRRYRKEIELMGKKLEDVSETWKSMLNEASYYDSIEKLVSYRMNQKIAKNGKANI